VSILADEGPFEDFYFKLAMPMRLGATSARVLRKFVDGDAGASNIAAAIQRNPHLAARVAATVDELGLQGERPGFNASIGLLGVEKVRDLVCALQLHRAVLGAHPKDKPDLAATLKYARQAQEHATGRGYLYSESAFAAGLVFDVIRAAGRESFRAPAAFEGAVDEVFRHGKRTATIAAELSRAIVSLPRSKFLYPACLIHNVGKLALELLFPQGTPGGYDAFRKALAQRGASRTARHLLETHAYGLGHDQLGAELTWHFRPLRETSGPILYHHQPYLGRDEGPEVYGLACMIAFCTAIADSFQAPKGAEDPVFSKWIGVELKGFEIDRRRVAEVLQELAARGLD
jgi:HD-like signal output (HDOD) protein